MRPRAPAGGGWWSRGGSACRRLGWRRGLGGGRRWRRRWLRSGRVRGLRRGERRLGRGANPSRADPTGAVGARSACDVGVNSFRQRRTDEQIARIASRQGGVISRRQLVRLGLTAEEIKYRVRTGRLRPIYRGVYAVGHDAIAVRGRLCAGLLLAGPGAAVSHRTAAALHKLIPSMLPFIDATVTGSRPRNQRDVHFHRATTLELTRKH